MAGRKAAPSAKQPGYEKLEKPKLIKWEKNMVAEGVFQGLKPGKFDKPLAKISEDGKTRVYACPTVLQTMLEGVAVGTQIKVVCLGQIIDTDYGQKAYDFDVYAVPI
jgi:hypothetical protein